MAASVPRQSMGSAGAPMQQLSSIQACISGVQSACDTHFDLVSEREVRRAQQHVAAEIAPLLRELIVRAEDALGQDERHARSLRNKATHALAQLEDARPASAFADGGVEGSPSVAALISQAELDEHRRQLVKLKDERKRLMDRVATLERQR
ncbi:hypothetical protein MSPP1_002418 [Malassezia sp. CBS 17886]|nr:hypothetical protein MSPP1_002418 [Malassezia sp. CBS 17886]